MAIRQNFSCPTTSPKRVVKFPAVGQQSSSAMKKRRTIGQAEALEEEEVVLSNTLVTNNVTLLPLCPHNFSHSLLTITACSCRRRTLSLCLG